jgi:hypothetical protein
VAVNEQTSSATRRLPLVELRVQRAEAHRAWRQALWSTTTTCGSGDGRIRHWWPP